MYDSFWLGMSFAFMCRVTAFRILRWPHTCLPLSFIPQLISCGIAFSFFDVARRIGIEEMLKIEETKEYTKQLRKDERHYDL